MGSVFMKSVPTSIVCDATYAPKAKTRKEGAGDDGDEVWADLEDAGSDADYDQGAPRRRKV